MQPYVMASDLYQFKLALILGRGKRLKKLLRKYPTERKFKNATKKEIAKVVGIKDINSETIKKLQEIDILYDELVTFQPQANWSKKPDANIIMGIDTEYFKSGLDSIQFVIMERLSVLKAGFIFTNQQLAPSVSQIKGIKMLQSVIAEYKPELIVGHNFNSDITILEKAAGEKLPELHFYDDTMDLLSLSNLSHIIGSASLNDAAKRLFNFESIGLYSAYTDPVLLIEYGIKDAIFPILIREYIINGQLDRQKIVIQVDQLIAEENRKLLDKNFFKLQIS